MKNEVRTMSDMDEFFTSRGIKVDRKYDGRAKVYYFSLTLDNCTKVFNFAYPSDVNNHEKYMRMTKACNYMLEEFGKFCNEHCNEHCIGLMDIKLTGLSTKEYYFPWSVDAVKKVIFNDPATIVFWSDGSKTVVKCSENDIYDPEKGLAMAFTKKMFGNDNSFHKLFTKWLPKEEPEVLEIKIGYNRSEAIEQIETLQQKLYRALGYFRGKN